MHKERADWLLFPTGWHNGANCWTQIRAVPVSSIVSFTAEPQSDSDDEDVCFTVILTDGQRHDWDGWRHLFCSSSDLLEHIPDMLDHMRKFQVNWAWFEQPNSQDD